VTKTAEAAVMSEASWDTGALQRGDPNAGNRHTDKVKVSEFVVS
jgi:hypothetical protein